MVGVSPGIHVARIELTDFRCYSTTQLDFPLGVTVITGDNGQGKTSILESVAWGALGRSFRGVPDAALVKSGQTEAIIRTFLTAPTRTRKIEVGLRRVGRNQMLLDGNSITRLRDLLGVLRVTIFAPDDLVLIKGGPANRRLFIDELLTTMNPRFMGVRADYDRVVRHRNALLRGGLKGADARATLAVFNEQLVVAAAELLEGRINLLDQIFPEVQAAYQELAVEPVSLSARYFCDWTTSDSKAAPIELTNPLSRAELSEILITAIGEIETRERERGTTLVGPHRDEWSLGLGGLESRSQASQGEQRTLALALRLAGHRAVGSAFGEEPVLVLDDVFSELDEYRSSALVERLAAPQTLVSTAGALPAGVQVTGRIRVANGKATFE